MLATISVFKQCKSKVSALCGFVKYKDDLWHHNCKGLEIPAWYTLECVWNKEFDFCKGYLSVRQNVE